MRFRQNSQKKREKKNKNIKQKGRSTHNPKSSTKFGKRLHDSNKQDFFQLPPNRSQYDLDEHFDFQQKTNLKLPNSRNDKKITNKKRSLFSLPNEHTPFQERQFSSGARNSRYDQIEIFKEDSLKKKPIKKILNLSTESPESSESDNEESQLLEEINKHPKFENSSESELEKESKSKTKSKTKSNSQSANSETEIKKNYQLQNQFSRSKSNQKIENRQENKAGKWVTLIGFKIKDKNTVLRNFQKKGYTIEKINDQMDGNWIHIRLQTERQARKLLNVSYIELYKGNIVAIIPYAADQIKKKYFNTKHQIHKNQLRNNNNNNNSSNSNNLRWKKSRQLGKTNELDQKNEKLNFNLQNNDMFDFSDDDEEDSEGTIIAPIIQLSSSDKKTSDSNNSENSILPKRNDGFFNALTKFVWGN
ncbi:nucleoporin nup35 [Anaeramoeba flamelloides]|uniref:Nucleoporin nup35 n=1 Tax=Anaeramoeba flamelloides TaxID=1746091 RepID=A0ABQ8XRN5_9EUKA|nr:nucleoporin nup35 [Anaeramoeba flamelloides]